MIHSITGLVLLRLFSRRCPVCPQTMDLAHSFGLASARQLVDRFRAGLHLPGGRREAGASRPTADQPPLPGCRPVPGQRAAQSRMTPPPGSRSRDRIDSWSYATPDPIHPASRLSADPPASHNPPITTKMRTAPTIVRPRPATGYEAGKAPQARADTIAKCGPDPGSWAAAAAQIALGRLAGVGARSQRGELQPHITCQHSRSRGGGEPSCQARQAHRSKPRQHVGRPPRHPRHAHRRTRSVPTQPRLFLHSCRVSVAGGRGPLVRACGVQ